MSTNRAEYGPVNRKIWEAVGDHIIALVEGRRALGMCLRFAKALMA